MSTPRLLPALLTSLALLAACGQGSPSSTSTAPTSQRAPGGLSGALTAGAEAAAAGETATPAPAGAPVVLFLGDSLTAGYGLDGEHAYPAVVARRLEQEGLAAKVVNAGISGDTTAGGLARLDWLLRQEPAVVVVALGANDGLRGVPLDDTEGNLREIVRRSREAGARVVLAGMMLPPNYGPAYTQGFQAIFPKLAREQGVALIPFLLEGVAAEPQLNLADGIHPNAQGQKLVAETVLPYLHDALR
ncbi:MAG TPA: arylesterase [Thermoanaerobaculia bacterium]|nr:arylesterase [Thermoanaerobaculia bacterium]